MISSKHPSAQKHFPRCSIYTNSPSKGDAKWMPSALFWRVVNFLRLSKARFNTPSNARGATRLYARNPWRNIRLGKSMMNIKERCGVHASKIFFGGFICAKSKATFGDCFNEAKRASTIRLQNKGSLHHAHRIFSTNTPLHNPVICSPQKIQHTSKFQ